VASDDWTDLKTEIAAACAAADKAGHDYDDFVFQTERRDLQRESSQQRMIYKVHDNGAQPVSQQQRAAPPMGVATQEWCDKHIRGTLKLWMEDFVTIIGAQVGEKDAEVLRVLRGEIAELRAEVEVLKQRKAANVTRIGRQDVA